MYDTTQFLITSTQVPHRVKGLLIFRGDHFMKQPIKKFGLQQTFHLQSVALQPEKTSLSIKKHFSQMIVAMLPQNLYTSCYSLVSNILCKMCSINMP